MGEVLYGVEGATDAPVAEALIQHAGGVPRQALVAGGASKLDHRIRRWNQRSNRRAVLVLRDWDFSDGRDCVADHVHELLGGPLQAPGMSLRVPVRAVESWLMADATGFTRFFGVRPPASPDDEDDPKGTLALVCARSRKRSIVEDMSPRVGSGRKVGPLFGSRIIEFASEHWDLNRARTGSPSLDRTVSRLEQLVRDGIW